MTRNPIGLCIQPQAKDFDRAKCVAHVRAAEYVTCQVLDDQQLAIDLDIPYAVFRDYNMEPQPGADPKGVARQTMAKVREIAARPGGRNILYYINNEPQWSKHRNDMYAYMIEESANEPGGAIGLCVGNYGVGTIKCGQGGEANWWDTPDAELLLKTLHKYRDVKLPNGSYAFVLGLDEYTGLFPWIASNGAEKRLNPQWEHRPSAIDILKDQWHLLRALQGILKACKRMGILPPHILIEEAVIDGMNDVIYTFGNPATEQHNLKLAEGATKPQGWRTLIPQYAIWYPGKDPEDVLADFHIWVWETVYAPFSEYILGMTIYCAWDASGDGQGKPAHKWKWFRVDNAPKYLKRMEGYRWSKVVTPSPPPTEPPAPPVDRDPTLPPEETWYDTKVAAHPDPIVIYAFRDTGSKRLDTILTANMEDYAPARTSYDPALPTWVALQKPGGKQGWALKGFIDFLDSVQEPPFEITADSPLFENGIAYANGMVAPVSIRPQPKRNITPDIGQLTVGGVPVKYIPRNKLSKRQQTYVMRADGEWYTILWDGKVGFVRAKDVRIDEKPTTPPPPTDTVTIPKTEYEDLLDKAAQLAGVIDQNIRLLEQARDLNKVKEIVRKPLYELQETI